MGAGEGLAVDPQGNMYFVTGNGTFDSTLDPQTGLPIHGDYGDSVVKVAVDPTSTPGSPNMNGWGLKVLDYFTPSDQQSLDDNDLDFGSGGPFLLPATATGRKSFWPRARGDDLRGGHGYRRDGGI